MFGVLGRFDDGRFVEIALVVDVQLAEGVLQAEDFRLLELRIFPAIEGVSSAESGSKTGRGIGPLRYLWILMMFMAISI